MTVARWLAAQLNHQQLSLALRGIADLEMGVEDCIWRLRSTKTTVEEKPPQEHQQSLLTSKLAEISREQFVRHIRRYVVAVDDI